MARSINGRATFSAVIHSLRGGASLVSLNQPPLSSAFVHQALLLRPMHSNLSSTDTQVASVGENVSCICAPSFELMVPQTVENAGSTLCARYSEIAYQVALYIR